MCFDSDDEDAKTKRKRAKKEAKRDAKSNAAAQQAVGAEVRNLFVRSYVLFCFFLLVRRNVHTAVRIIVVQFAVECCLTRVVQSTNALPTLCFETCTYYLTYY